jgi:hypothetical protein
MALSEKTVNTHNIKRAEVFAAHGLGNHDVRYAHPAFLGEGIAECCLCGKSGLRYLFAIKFDAPDMTTALGKVTTGLIRTEEVTLSVVGSKCITDWLDAVPESVEKLEALKRWSFEMKKMNAHKKKVIVEKLCAAFVAKHDLAHPEDKTARDAAYAIYTATGYNARCALTWYERDRLAKNAKKVKAGSCVKKTCETWLTNLDTVLARQVELDAAKAGNTEAIEPDSATEDNLDHDLAKMKDPAEAELIQRARNAWSAGKIRLNDWEQTTLTDIGKKVVKYHSFVAKPDGSSPQKKLYTKILVKLETAGKPSGTTTASATVLPGADDYVSASGLAGARY